MNTKNPCIYTFDGKGLLSSNGRVFANNKDLYCVDTLSQVNQVRIRLTYLPANRIITGGP